MSREVVPSGSAAGSFGARRRVLRLAVAALVLAACSGPSAREIPPAPTAGDAPSNTVATPATGAPPAAASAVAQTTPGTARPSSAGAPSRTRTPSSGSPGVERPCRKLSTTGRPTYVDTFFGAGVFTGLRSLSDPAYEDGLGLRLRTGYGYLDEIPPYTQRPGTFDLGARVEHDYRTCRHCVFALVDVSGDHIQHLFLATSGTLVLRSVDVDTGKVVGRLDDVRLVEIAATGYYAWAGPTGTSSCLHLDHLDIDTRAVPGGPCRTPEDCPNAVQQTCVAARCENT